MCVFFFVQSQLNVFAQGTEYNGVLMRGNGGKFEYSYPVGCCKGETFTFENFTQ